MCGVLIMMTLTFSAAAQEQSQKDIVEVARETREARLRKAVEETVNEMCSKADDPKMQETYPKIQEKCKDKPALIQTAFESSLKKLKEAKKNAEPPQEDKSWVNRALAAQSAPANSVSAAKDKADKLCRYGASASPTEVLDCVKAEGELEKVLRTQAATQNQGSRSSQIPAKPSNYVISLTGTNGLPVTGTCSFAGKAESYDDVLPAEHVVTAGRGAICSFVKKYVQGTLKMQIIQNGAVRNEAETEASYGVVTLDVDW
jgi:hypothetical protein